MSTSSTAFCEPSAIVTNVPAMKQPPPPDPCEPDGTFPSGFPNPHEIEIKLTPELNNAIHVPDTLQYPAEICFQTPDTL